MNHWTLRTPPLEENEEKDFELPEVLEEPAIIRSSTAPKRRVLIPSYPFPGDMAYGFAELDDKEIPFVPIEIPNLSYPQPKLKGASLKAFFSNFLP